MAHRQHQAGCPPTVQRGSGSSLRCRQSSTVSRWTPSRSQISASPTGSCFVCWSAMERRRLLPVGKAMPWGAGAGRLLDTRSVGREFVLGYPAAERSPTRRPRGDARQPAGGEEPQRVCNRRDVGPWARGYASARRILGWGVPQGDVAAITNADSCNQIGSAPRRREGRRSHEGTRETGERGADRPTQSSAVRTCRPGLDGGRSRDPHRGTPRHGGSRPRAATNTLDVRGDG